MDLVKSLILSVAVVGPFFAEAAQAQSSPIAVIDVQKVINQSIAGKAARNNMESELRKSEARLSKMKGELDKLRSDLEKQSSVLSSEALEGKRRTIAKRERELSDEVRVQQDELARRNSSEIEKVVTEIRRAALEISEQRKLGVVIERDPRVVLYSSERIDISDAVVKELDLRKTQL